MAAERRQTRPFGQGDLVDATVASLARRGGAIAEVEGAEVRVLGGVPGDRATLRITHTGKHVNVGQIHTLEHPSPHRVEAPCPVVTTCGGCPWQPAAQTLQRDHRLSEVSALLDPFCNPDTRRHGWVGPTDTMGYRTRALMVLRHRGGAIRMGFYAPGTQDLVPAEPCVVQHPQVNAVLERAHAVLKRHDWPTWRGPDRQGVLRGLLYRIDPTIGEGLLTLVLSVQPGPKIRAAVDHLIRIEGVCGVHANIHTAPGGPMLGEQTVHLRGKRRQIVTCGDLELQVGPTAFVQTQHAMGVALAQTLGSWLPDKMSHLVDLYAGIGVLGLKHRDRAQKVTLVESHPGAVADARRNVDQLEAIHVTVVGEDAATAAAKALDPGTDAVILDPPRAGCAPPVLDALAALEGAPTLLYASCDPRSLARDLARLAEAGFRVRDLALFDMFPHTPHVEVAVALQRAT